MTQKSDHDAKTIMVWFEVYKETKDEYKSRRFVVGSDGNKLSLGYRLFCRRNDTRSLIPQKRRIFMNTIKSEKKVNGFLASGQKYKRMCHTYEKLLNAKPEQIFPLLCPSRELDWINGWDCDLIYTSTGYAEKDCIFTTPEGSIFDSGIWILTQFVPNEKVELVRTVQDSRVVHIRITLKDNNDGTTTGMWEEKYTALNEQGNEMVENMPGPDTQFLTELSYYLKNGELMKA